MSTSLAPRAGGRTLRVLAVALGGLALTGLFVVLTFPYERLSVRLERALADAAGRPAEIGAFGPGLGRIGPALVASRIMLRGTPPVRIDELRFRPALTLATLRGEPALRIDARAEAGRAVGTLFLGDAPGFAGRLEDVDLGAPPLAGSVPELHWTGRGEVALDLRLAGQGPRGRVTFELRDGALAHDFLPVGVSYTDLRGEIAARDDGVVELRGVELSGGLLDARLEGTVGPLDGRDDPPLDLRVRIARLDAGARSLLAGYGLPTGSDGTLELAIRGTASDPLVRPAAGRAGDALP